MISVNFLVRRGDKHNRSDTIELVVSLSIHDNFTVFVWTNWLMLDSIVPNGSCNSSSRLDPRKKNRLSGYDDLESSKSWRIAPMDAANCHDRVVLADVYIRWLIRIVYPGGGEHEHLPSSAHCKSSRKRTMGDPDKLDITPTN